MTAVVFVVSRVKGYVVAGQCWICGRSVSPAMGFVSAPARADDAYLCGSDRVVYVAVADLELKKHTDPCIAAYYGLKIDQPVKTAVETLPAVIAAVEVKPAEPEVAQLKLLALSEIPERTVRKPERQASLEAPRAMAGTDFRNVKVLNAASPDAAWFRHTK